ncbi:MAG: nucleotidyltransferase domain-containing protein [Pseudomonadota bacterium]
MIHINVPKEKLTASCRSRHIRWMACFGSAVRDDFGPDSDVDVLVAFAPDHTPGWDIVDIEEDLSALLAAGRWTS